MAPIKKAPAKKRLAAPKYPTYTASEREALAYKKQGNKLYRNARISIPGTPDPSFPDIDFRKNYYKAQELIDLISHVSSIMIDVEIELDYDHYGAYSEYDSCEVTVRFTFHGKIEFEADGELLANFNSAKAKEREYNAAEREYKKALKARAEAEREERDRKAFERLKKKFPDG